MRDLEEILAELSRNNQGVNEVTLNSTNGFSYSFGKLPLFINGESTPVAYDVLPAEIAGFNISAIPIE